MIPVSEALDQLFALAPVMPAETVPLERALGRVLAQDVVTTRTQPPFAASAMDGYAVCEATQGFTFTVIGEAAAGGGFAGSVAPGQAVRIFTGAPIPDGATRVIIQEDVARDGDRITVTEDLGSGTHIRPAGADFGTGFFLQKGRILTPQDVALLAAMNSPDVPVLRKPQVAILPTGDELVMPGETPGPDQIIASNSFGLAAMITQNGGSPRMLPIARDNRASLEMGFNMARDADLILTIGGASVGDHDLVAPVAQALGLDMRFHKVAMRPGKPLMSGVFTDENTSSMLIGLPGNPVSAMVCGSVFVLPVLRTMLGQPAAPAPRLTAWLREPMGANGPREHYMRAHVKDSEISADFSQDSSLLSVLSDANALLVRPLHDEPRAAGDTISYIPL